MFIDQGTGAHHAQVEYLFVGLGWSWLSEEFIDTTPDPPSIDHAFSINRTLDVTIEL